MECSIGYSFDGEEVFIEMVTFEETDMSKVLDYMDEICYNHQGRQVSDLKGLSILIK